jgi:hypothetical protein
MTEKSVESTEEKIRWDGNSEGTFREGDGVQNVSVQLEEK